MATVTFQGNPLTLVGNQLNVGDAAPDAELLANDLSPVKLSSFSGKVRVILSVPSLTRRYVTSRQRDSTKQQLRLGMMLSFWQ